MPYEIKRKLEGELFTARGALERANAALFAAENTDGAAVARIIVANTARAAALNGESNETSTSIAMLNADLHKAQDWGKATSGLVGRARTAQKLAQGRFDRAALAERKWRYGIKLLRYIEALEKFVNDFYKPVIEVFNEDPQRLGAYHNPMFGPDSIAWLRAQIELYVNGTVPTRLEPGMVNVRFVRASAGSRNQPGRNLRIC